MKKNIIRELTVFAHRAVGEGLSYGISGNISAKASENIIFIKAKGVWLEKATARDFVAIRYHRGRKGKGDIPSRASSEAKTHLACYEARPDIGAVVHVHPPCSTLIASSTMKFGPVSEEYHHVLRRGFVKIPYFPAGSALLARKVGEAVRKTDVALLSHHGVLCVGKDLQEAFLRALVVEYTAKLIVFAHFCKTKMEFLR
jgi:L-fuculose-phosphate aldolase